jgi:2'-5' RNA ligase
MRLFFALWPSRATARALNGWARAVARRAGGRPVSPQNVHLTLVFLGDADPQRAIAAAGRVRGEAFDLPLETAEYWRHNRVVWAGPEQAPEPLAQLVEALKQELYRAEFILERRPFAAHVTLLRKAPDPEVLPDPPHAAWPVTEFVLARSTRSAAGSTYETVARFPFAQTSRPI